MRNFHENAINSPVACMYKCIMKYNLQHMLIEIVTSDYVNLDQTKSKVKKIVWELETTRWKCTMLLYPELHIYRECISGPQMHAWYKYLDNHPYMYSPVSSVMAVLHGGQPKGIQCNFQSKYCQLCTLRARESPAHVLFECPALQETRHSTWPRLLRTMPTAMSESIQAISNDEKVRQIISCYGGSYIPDWNEIYTSTAQMVQKMYITRHALYSSNAAIGSE